MKWPWAKDEHNEWIGGFKAGFKVGFDQAFGIAHDQLEKVNGWTMEQLRTKVRDEYALALKEMKRDADREIYT